MQDSADKAEEITNKQYLTITTNCGNIIFARFFIGGVMTNQDTGNPERIQYKRRELLCTGAIISDEIKLSEIADTLYPNTLYIRGHYPSSGLSAEAIKRNISRLWKFFEIQLISGEVSSIRDHMQVAEFFVTIGHRRLMIQKQQFRPGDKLKRNHILKGITDTFTYRTNSSPYWLCPFALQSHLR